MYKKRLIGLLLCFLTLFLNSGVAAASEFSQMPNGIMIGDEEGIHVSKDGNYYIDVRSIYPGDIIYRNLTIENLEPNSKFSLSMGAGSPRWRGPNNLLEMVNLKIILEDDLLYDGDFGGHDEIELENQRTYLGEYVTGDRKILHLVLTVSEDLEISQEKSAAEISWIFYAIKVADETPTDTANQTPTDPGKESPTNTGKGDSPLTEDSARFFVILFCGCMIFSSMILLGIYKSQKRKG